MKKALVMANVTVIAVNAADTLSRFITNTNINGIFNFRQLQTGTAYHFRFSFIGYLQYDVKEFPYQSGRE